MDINSNINAADETQTTSEYSNRQKQPDKTPKWKIQRGKEMRG